jgi:hypothetical protein
VVVLMVSIFGSQTLKQNNSQNSEGKFALYFKVPIISGSFVAITAQRVSGYKWLRPPAVEGQ